MNSLPCYFKKLRETHYYVQVLILKLHCLEKGDHYKIIQSAW